MRPPRIARVLLRLLLPRTLVDSIEGDLLEGFERHGRGWRAWSWFWRQALSLPYLSLSRANRRIRRRAGRSRRPAGPAAVVEATGLDFKVAARSLRRRLGFAFVTTATLAASIGAVTLLFSVLKVVLLQPLPYRDPTALATVFGTNQAWRESEGVLRRSWDRAPVTLSQVEAWRQAEVPVTAITAYQPFSGAELRVGDEEGDVDVVAGVRVDEGFFETLGVAPAIGRPPTGEELAQGAAVAVVHDRLWRARFAADPAALGETFELSGTTYTLIGVMPPDFFFPDGPEVLWTPIPSSVRADARDLPLFHAVARMPRGARLADVGDRLDSVAAHLAEESPQLAGMGARVAAYRQELYSSVQTGLKILMGTAVLVLLLACVNLANALLARGIERRHELAVRSALGQSRPALVRTLFAEAGILTILGGTSGVLLAIYLLHSFVAALDSTLGGLPRSDQVTIDVPVLLLVLGTTTLTTLTAGLLPAFGAARRAPADSLAGPRGVSSDSRVFRSQRGLLFVQAAMVMVLVAGSGLLLHSLARMGAVDPGYTSRDIAWLALKIEGPAAAEADLTVAAAPVAIGTLVDRAESLPGVLSATAAATIPGGDGHFLVPARVTADEPIDMRKLAISDAVDAGYFETLGIRMIRGRTFAEGAASDVPQPAVIDELLAKRLFGDEDPIGGTFVVGKKPGAGEMVVVGVSAAIRQLSLLAEPFPQYVRPLAAAPGSELYLLARTEGPAEDALAALRAAVALPGAEVTDAGTLRATLGHALAPARLRLALVGGFTAIALLLAVLGIFGVVSHHLLSTRRDVGIRVALGATGSSETRRLVGSALLPTLAGLLVGLGGALLISQLLGAVLYELPPTDPISYAAAGLLFLLVATLTAWIPARGATRVAPIDVLKEM